VLRHLTSQCLSFVARTLSHTQPPSLLGAGIKMGCEATIHGTPQLLSSTSDPDKQWTLFLDFSNAFNSIDH